MASLDGVIQRIGARRRRASSAIASAMAGVQRRVSTGMVALTFDDGPHPASTGRVLDALAELDVKATFFCVGRNAERHPELVRRALDEGHAVGSHSFSHPHPAHTSLGELAREYRTGRQAVSAVAGQDVRLFRAPPGHPRPRGGLLVRRHETSTWLWTVDPRDWEPGVTMEHVSSVAGSADSGDVILLHDWVEQPYAPEALDRSATISALAAVVRDVRRRGLGFTTLPA